MPRFNNNQRVFVMLRPLNEDCAMSGFCRIEASRGNGQIIFRIHGINGEEPRGVLVTRDSIVDCGVLRCLRGQGTMICDVSGGYVNGVALESFIGAGIINAGVLLLLADFGHERLDARVIRVMVDDIYDQKRRNLQTAALDTTAFYEIIKRESIPEVAQEKAIMYGTEVYPTFVAEVPDSPSAHITDTSCSSINTVNRWEGICVEIKSSFENAVENNELESIPNTLFRRMELPIDMYGMDYYLLGVRFRLGSPEALCYAVPGTYRPYPPPGLEGYRWRASDDGKKGYWLSWLDAVTGVPIPG